MLISNKVAGYFDAKTRARGKNYFRDGSVISLEAADKGVYARVDGSDLEPYEVYVEETDLDPELQNAHCTCPRFADGYLCKHIWAVILVCEDGGELEAEDDDDEFWHDEDDEYYPRTRTAVVHGTGRNRQSWQSLLRHVGDVHQRTNETNLFDGTHAKQNEVWYAIDVGASLSAGQLLIDLHIRETKKNGEWGKFKQLYIRGEDLKSLSREDDRHALARLISSEPQQAYRYSYGYSDFSSASRLKVLTELYDDLLPLLAATGRLVWVLEREIGIEEARPISWDDGRPWQFQLMIDDDAKAKKFRLTGQLRRGREVRPLDAPVLLQSDGVVLWEDSLARLDAGGHFAWIAALRGSSEIVVPYAGRDELLKHLWAPGEPPPGKLPTSLALKAHSDPARGCLQIKKEDAGPIHYRAQNELFANVSFEYGEQTIALDETRQTIVDAGKNRVLLRDREAEAALIEQLRDNRIRPVTKYERSDGHVKFAKSRMAEVVGGLVKAGWIVEAEGKLIRSPGGVSVSVASNVDWFELDGQIDFDGLSASLPDLLAAVKKGDRYIRLGDGSHGMLPDEWLAKYGGMIEMGDVDGDAVRFRPTQALLLDALLAAQENVKIDRGYRNFRTKLAKFAGVKPRSAPRAFRGELREYQRQGLGWLHFLREFRFGGCLADDMGLGKTIQVLALLESRRKRKIEQEESRRPSLVVVPKSLVFNWIEEAGRFTPNLRMLNYTGQGRKALRAEFDEHDVIVTTYGTLRQDIAKLKDVRFDYAILDEAQAIKNPGSQSAKACRLIQADHRLAMTGTPVENHLGELWSLFEFINPGLLGSSAVASSLLKSAGKGDAASLEFLRKALAPYILRRTKEQVLTELPEKTEQTLYCEMEPKQRKQYNELREYYRVQLQNRIEEVGLAKAKIHVLEALLRLRQAACHPGLLDKAKIKLPSAKLDTLISQLQEIVDEGHKALVFSQFTSLLAIVRESLDAKNLTYEYLDGRTRKRQEKVKRFQEDADCPLFLISLKAGGHGLNLTAADYVYILDPWWNPAVEAQAVDRAHRIGQTRRVFAYRLICRDTVEEKIIQLQQQKRELADAIIAENNSVIRSLTAEDLNLLLS